MYSTFLILNYPKRFFFAGFFSMLFFRIALSGKGRFSKYKLMGTGLNGGFDLRPDILQWTIMCFQDTRPAYREDDSEGNIQSIFGNFIARWTRFFRCETGLFVLQVTGGHGNWDAHPVFKNIPQIPQNIEISQHVAVLTRASIRFRRLSAFWKQVPAVNHKIRNANGLLFSIGTGELPVIRQATFSIWQSAREMKQWAYGDPDHLHVIQRTRDEGWYKEELFLRMSILLTAGTVKGKTMNIQR